MPFHVSLCHLRTEGSKPKQNHIEVFRPSGQSPEAQVVTALAGHSPLSLGLSYHPRTTAWAPPSTTLPPAPVIGAPMAWCGRAAPVLSSPRTPSGLGTCCWPLCTVQRRNDFSHSGQPGWGQESNCSSALTGGWDSEPHPCSHCHPRPKQGARAGVLSRTHAACHSVCFFPWTVV